MRMESKTGADGEDKREEEKQKQLPGLAAEVGGRSTPHSHAAHPW
jgi:hypothetical protein